MWRQGPRLSGSEDCIQKQGGAPSLKKALPNRTWPLLSPPNPTMADKANKYPENVTGKFYVDDQCIDCDLCRETAPANFKRNDDGGHSFLYKQPENPDEEKLCKEAMEGCPVEAIGSDGE
jgi:ferredoxin